MKNYPLRYLIVRREMRVNSWGPHFLNLNNLRGTLPVSLDSTPCSPSIIKCRKEESIKEVADRSQS